MERNYIYVLLYTVIFPSHEGATNTTQCADFGCLVCSGMNLSTVARTRKYQYHGSNPSDGVCECFKTHIRTLSVLGVMCVGRGSVGVLGIEQVECLSRVRLQRVYIVHCTVAGIVLSSLPSLPL